MGIEVYDGYFTDGKFYVDGEVVEIPEGQEVMVVFSSNDDVALSQEELDREFSLLECGYFSKVDGRASALDAIMMFE